MAGRSSRNNSLRAELSLVTQLMHIDASDTDGYDEESAQARADALLARITWSRLTEPGDGLAGGLLAVMGASDALALLVQHPSPKQLVAAAKNAGFEMPERAAQEALDRWLPRLNRNETVADIERAVATGLRVVVPGDRLWPTNFEVLELHAPNMLWVRGEPRHLSAHSLGVVGARASSGYGSHVTAEIVDGVCAAGITIVSGAAYGIDAVAHRTALAADTPTVAVVAGGADRPYPQAHEALLDRISEAGAVCSEMVPGSAPTKWRFLQRNRLIAALTQATLVTEAGMNSGSLNTAGHASQLGKQLGAVPGPITSAASAGCHRLLRDYGATLITNAREACELVGVNDQLAIFGNGSGDSSGGDGGGRGDGESDGSDAHVQRDSAWHRRVLDALPLRGTRRVEDVARHAGLTVGQTRGVLAELELLGRAQQKQSPDGADPKWGLVR